MLLRTENMGVVQVRLPVLLLQAAVLSARSTVVTTICLLECCAHMCCCSMKVACSSTWVRMVMTSAPLLRRRDT